MPEINLLKNEIKNQRAIPLSRVGSKAIYVMLGLLGLELLIYIGLGIFNYSVKRSIAETERQTTAIAAEIGQFDADRNRAILTQIRLKNLAGLLVNHAEWTPVLTELEKYTLQKAVYTAMQVDEVKHTFSLTGVVSSYTEIGKFMLGLAQSPNFSNITLKSSSQDESGAGGFTFDVDVDFNPKLLIVSD